MNLETSTGQQVRMMCRSGEWTKPTVGMAAGFTQANLVVLSRSDANAFAAFCRLNPKPCPLLEELPPGSFEPTFLAPGADLRTDLPRYRIFRDGECVDNPTSVESVWSDDCVAFLIGCSFTFDAALRRAGLPVRHIDQSCNVPMYRTTIDCDPAPPFAGPMIVSMRPMTPRQAEDAVRITRAYPRAHGEPVHLGDPLTIGIENLDRPDYGDPVAIRPDEIPVFWACGVTPMEALIRAKLDFAVTHDPGHMFVSDVRDSELCESMDDQ